MWATLASLAFSVFKFLLQRSEGKKLSDQEFLKHIEAHQLRRAGVAQQANDFEANMQQAYDEITKNENSE